MAILAEGIGGDCRAKRVERIQGALKSIDLAIAAAKPGSLLLIQADTADETVVHLKSTYGAQ